MDSIRTSQRSEAPYARLQVAENDDDDGLGQTYSAPSLRKTTGPQNRTAWIFFISCCIIALAVSTVNLTYLSATTSASVQKKGAQSPLKTPSVYLGLEKLGLENSYCRSRGTFPKYFYTFRPDDTRKTLERIHAPDDKTTLSFGGPISAFVDFYIPDYGLENCTMTAKLREDPYTTISRSVDVFLMPSKDDLNRRVFLNTLELIPGRESTTKPFFCPSRSHVFLEWRCAAPDCKIEFPLEGVTSLTASAESLLKTGFRVTQYESLHCITTA